MFEQRPYERDSHNTFFSFDKVIDDLSERVPMEMIVLGLLRNAARRLNDLVDEDQWEIFNLGMIELSDAIESTTCRVPAEDMHYLETMYRYDRRHFFFSPKDG